MRLTRFHTFLLIGGSLMLVGPAIGLSQQPGPASGSPGGGFPGGGFMGGAPGGSQGGMGGGFMGGGGRGNRGNGGGGRNFDPGRIFDFLSGNKGYIDVNQYLPMAQMRDPSAADKINDFMQRMGINNGQLTRDQFVQFMQERMAQRQADRGQGGPGGQNPNNPNNPTDANANDLTDDGEPPPPDDKRSVVYRASNLPQGLPTWFATYDSDRDGQVALYEWKAAGGSLSDFQQIDANGDGFITIQEALKYQQGQPGGTAVASAGFNGGPSYPGYNGGFNGQPNGFNGGGRGNRGGGFNGGGRGNRGGGGFNGGSGRGSRGNRGNNGGG